MYINKVHVYGNLTRDPEMRQLPSGMNVTNLGIATNRYWKDKDGNKQDEVEYHNVVLFGRLAEIADQYLRKGSSAYVEGRLRTSSWDADGVKKYKTEIIADVLQLGPRTGGSSQAPAEQPEEIGVATDSGSTINPEDIPF